MAAIPQITGVVAIDGKTIKQLEVSHATWFKFHPELRAWPWLIVYDKGDIPDQIAYRVASDFGSDHVLPWPPDGTVYDTQRERMLSAFVCGVPHEIRTEFWWKIDCDSICVGPCDDWLDPAWFQPDARSEYNAWISNSWPYSRAKGGGGTIQEWCEKLEVMGDRLFPGTPRLGLIDNISSGGGKLLRPRMASWFSFYNTDWTRQIANGLATHYGIGKMPVPSQDSVHWVCAERQGYRRLAVRLLGKRRGFTNVPRFDNLVRRVEEIMGH